MSKRKAIHLLRSTRTTWCGRSVTRHGTGILAGDTIPADRIADDRAVVTCRTCLKADAAEARRNG